jgi:dimethylhistidine N-methyltransferase
MATVTTEIPACRTSPETNSASSVGELVREGLSKFPKQLPPWLFYDEAGSLLFEQITELPEYYLTRVERRIFEDQAGEMIRAAAAGEQLRILELGAGSAEKTRLLLAAAIRHQGLVGYQPIDVSSSALAAAQQRLEMELPEVHVDPLVADYTQGLSLNSCDPGERRLVLFIGSSIGNFSREEALVLLQELHATLEPGDQLLLGVDLAPREPATGGKNEASVIVAYDDSQGVTAEFNKNMLARLNQELGADFSLENFQHRIRWNREESRIEMHLESSCAQTVSIAALEQNFEFTAGETIHTENSYKYRIGEVEALLNSAGFSWTNRWSDPSDWFAVYLATRNG